MTTFAVVSDAGERVVFGLATRWEAESELESWEAFRPDMEFHIIETDPDGLPERVYDALRAAGRKDLADEFSDWYKSLEANA